MKKKIKKYRIQSLMNVFKLILPVITFRDLSHL